MSLLKILIKFLFKAILLFVAFVSFTINTFAQKYPEMVQVEGGEFLMGDLKQDFPPFIVKWKKLKNDKTIIARLEGDVPLNRNTLRKVTVSSFYISEKPISVDQYNAYCYSMGFDMPKLPSYIKGTDPMVNVSWEDAESYCRWLSRKTGKKYRMPTEAEWEYTSKGAYLSLYSPKKKPKEAKELIYSEIELDNDAVLKQNGLVWEWVLDVNKSDSIKVNSIKSSQHNRVIRKGATGKNPSKEQPYFRKGLFQDVTVVDVGFRVAESLIKLVPFKTDIYLNGKISKGQPKK